MKKIKPLWKKVILRVKRSTGDPIYLPTNEVRSQATDLREDLSIEGVGLGATQDASGEWIPTEESIRERATYKFGSFGPNMELEKHEWMIGLTRDELISGVDGHQGLPEHGYGDVMNGTFAVERPN